MALGEGGIHYGLISTTTVKANQATVGTTFPLFLSITTLQYLDHRWNYLHPSYDIPERGTTHLQALLFSIILIREVGN